VVHRELQACFLRCFNDGHVIPDHRPTAKEWLQALKAGITDLQVCRKVKHHYFSKSYGKCYWCQRRASLGVDIFSGTRPPARKAKKPQTLKAPAQSNPRPMAKQHRFQPIRQPSPAPAPTAQATPFWQGAWIQFGGIMAIATGVLTLLIWLNRARMDASEFGLSEAASAACLVLVALCFIWIKLLNRQSTP
jgi:DNA-binding helix-hairpin-helix protein with protein kinase domain